ncbi:YncE family protein [Ottowia thiooxydans]|uniref:YVTN family beta-propeller protein n=1 Tax=Ottowia thiooxydans TaxID=219182 RepID=A0ABV2Q2Q7_9BURK
MITASRLFRCALMVGVLSACAFSLHAQQVRTPSPATTPVTAPATGAGAGPAGSSAAPGQVSRPAQPGAKPAVATQSSSAPAPLSRKGAPVFVLNSLDGNVSVIDPATWTETKRIPTGREPHHLYLTPDEKSVIIANAGADSLTFIDPRTGEEQRTIRGILDPYHLRFSPDMKWFVTAANRLNHVDIYRWDGTNPTLVKRIPTSRTPSHLWIDSRSKTIWASMQDSDELVVIDIATQTLTSRVKTGPMPADVYVTPDDKTLLLGLTGSDGVEVYDVAGGKAPVLVRKIPTGKGAHAFRSAGDGKHVYVSNRVANSISRINYQTLAVDATFPAPSGPDCMDISSDGKLIMVGSRWAKKLTIIDVASQKVIRQIPVGKSPHGVWTLDHVARH